MADGLKNAIGGNARPVGTATRGIGLDSVAVLVVWRAVDETNAWDGITTTTTTPGNWNFLTSSDNTCVALYIHIFIYCICIYIYICTSRHRVRMCCKKDLKTLRRATAPLQGSYALLALCYFIFYG